MADKPTQTPEWADGASDIVEPLAAKKAVGWAAEERPPNSYMNWIQGNITDWLKWLFVGKLGRADLTDRTPVLAFADQNGRDRLYIDPSGYFGGPAIQEHYVNYPVTALFTGARTGDVLCPGIEGDTDANCSLEAVPAILQSAPYTRMKVKNAAVSQGVRVFTQGGEVLIGDSDNQVAIFEVRLQLETVGANEVDVFFGFHGDPDSAVTFGDPSAHTFAMFEKLSGDTNWQLSVGDGSVGSSTDSGTPPVAGVLQTFRVEYHGLNTPLGVDAGFAVTRFFIDGALELEVADTNVPDAAAFGVALRAEATGTGPAADVDVDFLPVRVGFTQMLDWDVPA